MFKNLAVLSFYIVPSVVMYYFRAIFRPTRFFYQGFKRYLFDSRREIDFGLYCLHCNTYRRKSPVSVILEYQTRLSLQIQNEDFLSRPKSGIPILRKFLIKLSSVFSVNEKVGSQNLLKLLRSV